MRSLCRRYGGGVPAKDDIQLPVIRLDILQMHLAVGDSLDIYSDFNEQELLVSIPGTGSPLLDSELPCSALHDSPPPHTLTHTYTTCCTAVAGRCVSPDHGTQ